MDFKEKISEDLRWIELAQVIVELRTRIKEGEKKKRRIYDGKEVERRDGISMRI
jgi:hypothetical protein